MADGHAWDFFIAHAGGDSEHAARLCDALARGGRARVFLDVRCLQLGDDWDRELAAAQKTALVTVVMVSSNTAEAYYEREEIAAAVAMARDKSHRGRVVPIYLDGHDGDVPYGLRLKHGLSLTPQMTLEDAAERLIDLLQRLKTGAGATTSGPGAVPSPRRAATPGLLHAPPTEWVSPVRHNPWRYKLVVFDLDGTLVRGPGFDFSWEMVWKGLGFSVGLQNELKRTYRRRVSDDGSAANRIKAYQEWCESACRHFKTRRLTRSQLRALCEPLHLTVHCRETLTSLRNAGFVTAIVSGGIDTVLEDTFPDFRDYVDFVFINQLVFTEHGVLDDVCATAYDFQGKADALDIVIERVGCSAGETVFVGDHFNDEHIMLKVDRAIAYPPSDEATRSVANVSITVDDLLQILPYLMVD